MVYLVWQYHVPKTGTRVRTRVRTRVHVYVLEYSSTMVHVYHNGIRVRTNITLSQKRLEIQALRCNVHVYHYGTRVHVYVHVYNYICLFLLWYGIVRATCRSQLKRHSPFCADSAAHSPFGAEQDGALDTSY